jgi:L-seryl-tRNA(Ser) seleniumtransferase
MLDRSRAGEIPIVAGLRVRPEDLEQRALRLLVGVTKALGMEYQARVARSETAVGGGSLPEHRLSGWAVVIEGPKLSAVAAGLRRAPTPVLARVHDEALWLDVRTLRDDEFSAVERAVSFALSLA